MGLDELLRQGELASSPCPWPRAVVGVATWNAAIAGLAGADWELLGLWGEADRVHMALLDAPKTVVGIVTLDCPTRRYPSVGLHHPPALRLERTIRDLRGLEPQGLPDPRAWLDHGNWGLRHPLAAKPEPTPIDKTYAFLPVEGAGLHQIPVGPVHAGIIEPGHFRFTANGETVVRLEPRLGYVHKGIEGLIAGANLGKAGKLAARASGDSTVAYGLAFARAVEAALGVEVPLRAHHLRALMAELERLANHLGDFGAICNDASFALMLAHCGVLREKVLRGAGNVFGHRLMRDLILPGGVATDINQDGIQAIRSLVSDIQARFPALVELYDNTASLQDRTVTTGTVKADLARQYAPGGFIGRASGRTFDARKHLAYAPYDKLAFEIPVLEAGDVNARVWIRVREIEQSLGLVTQLLERMPQGELRIDLPMAGEVREGMALVEGFRGDILVWLRLNADNSIAHCHLRDPSWFQWPLLEAAIQDNIVADFPLCNKSFNCSYSGHDL
ncbi:MULTISPECIES: NADH-quinone oxidoreductase subunit C [unclassified Bradyrhizobium]|uniref:hydrogenase large subunit n=1 Tax=unclassified Bradyrhizobium TaxID=2631580 RepID=UPI002915F2B0|nr:MULTISPECIES: NADH-quinone oxidoreductase subunit C [unclassified Bradyrhizobium]